ncbi:hypothetical protein [Bifidobacterium longum]|nr:hypothetical protein [Bifidobacterium longum]KFI64134.1 hypothetical protein BLSL_0926 [Bifidobacterium longum subsp. longum]
MGLHVPEGYHFLGEWGRAWRDPKSGLWTVAGMREGSEGRVVLSDGEARAFARLVCRDEPAAFATAGRKRDGRERQWGSGRRTGPHPFGRSPAPVGAVLMDGYWWGVLTPFAIILGILLLYLTGNLFGAIVSWAWKKAHYGLLKKGWIAEDYDEDSKEWTTRPGAERLAAALTRYGEYRMLPCFGWMILIVRDHKPNDKKKTDGR